MILFLTKTFSGIAHYASECEDMDAVLSQIDEYGMSMGFHNVLVKDTAGRVMARIDSRTKMHKIVTQPMYEDQWYIVFVNEGYEIGRFRYVEAHRKLYFYEP